MTTRVRIVVACVVLLAGCSSAGAVGDQAVRVQTYGGSETEAGRTLAPPTTEDVVVESAGDESASAEVVEVEWAEAANPTTVRIPAIEVEAPIIALGLNEDGSIEVPEAADETGWWKDGPEPGEKGPAVILGHVDSYTGPAVFFRLSDLEPGDEIHVDRADETLVTYRVDRIETHNKDEFPTNDVYGSTDAPELRLVTCGGNFDRDERSYDDNVIVFASLVA